MSDVYLPTLPGLRCRGRTRIFNETEQESASGITYRIKNWSGPKYRYAYEVWMRTANGEYATFQGHILAHSGPHESFLLVDPVDGVTRRVKFADPEIEDERIVNGAYSASFELITTNTQPGDDGAGTLDGEGLY